MTRPVPSLSVPPLSTCWPFSVLRPVAARPLSEVPVGARVSVPAPALMSTMAAFETPLPPLIGAEIVRSPTVQTLSGEKPLVWLNRPPESVETLPARTRMPPELRLSATPALSERPALPSMVREFGATFAAAAVVPVVSRTLLFAAMVFAAEYSPAAKGRRMAVVAEAAAASPVAKEVPCPVAEASINAHGRRPLVVAPVAPVWPLKLKPALSLMVAMPAPAAVPREVPRKRTEGAVGPVVAFCALAWAPAAAEKTRFACWPAWAVTVMTEKPRPKVGVARVSSVVPLALPTMFRAPPLKSMLAAAPRRLLSGVAPLSRTSSTEPGRSA